MGVPDDVQARFYYRSAGQRLEDAHILLRADRTTGSVYLAGYAVECVLKALILATATPSDREERLRSFRGAHAHSYEWLKGEYLGESSRKKGPRFPPEINKDFILVNSWSTHLRYDPKSWKRREAGRFLDAADRIIHWADGRL